MGTSKSCENYQRFFYEMVVGESEFTRKQSKRNVP